MQYIQMIHYMKSEVYLLIVKIWNDEEFLNLNSNWLEPSSLLPGRFVTWRSRKDIAESKICCLRFFYSSTYQMEGFIESSRALGLTGT